MKNLNEMSKQITELIDEGMTDISFNIGELHVPVKPKDKIAIEILWQLFEHPEIETVGDVVEVLQDAITWHQLFYIIKHSDEQNTEKSTPEIDDGCPDCEGAGYVFIEDSTRTCSMCGGTGKFIETSPRVSNIQCDKEWRAKMLGVLI